MSATERVRRVLAASARIRDGGDALGREARERLYDASGLSRAGVDLALATCLETTASDEDLARFVARAVAADRCHVVLSAHVCTAPVRAVAYAVATSARVFVKPSRRDPVVAELLARALAEDDAFEGEVAITPDVTAGPGDEIHVYGGAQAVAAYAALANGARIAAHGPGFGAVIVGEEADAEALARDVVLFDQQGCLSPRVALVHGDAKAFARALDAALGAWSKRVPLGRPATVDYPVDRSAIADQRVDRSAIVDAEEAAYRRTAEVVGGCFFGAQHTVGWDASPRALVLPPATRAVHVVAVRAGQDAALLAPWASALTTLGADDMARLYDPAFRGDMWRFRAARLGQMQTPPFDGPVDLRRFDHPGA